MNSRQNLNDLRRGDDRSRTNASPNKASARQCVYNLVTLVALILLTDVGIAIAHLGADVETMIVQMDASIGAFVSALMDISKHNRLRSGKTVCVNW